MSMRSSAIAIAIGCFVFSFFLFLSPSVSYSEDPIYLTIDVAPNVLNIQSHGTVVTIHTDIAYYSVEVYSVYLNGIAIQSWKADNRGNFVAKFSMDDVKSLDGLVIEDDNTLQIVGLTKGGVPFVGKEDIKVIDVLPRGR